MDSPIEGRSEDTLRRDRIAKALVRQVLGVRPQDGFVLGIVGAWGSGKTSLLTLMKSHLREDDVVVDFNPWLYTDKNELVLRFLAQVRAQLPDDEKHAAAKNALERFRGTLSPLTALGSLHPAFLVVGVLANISGRLRKAAKELDGTGSKTPETTAEDERATVHEALSKLPGRLVVFIDDIDRLNPEEVAEMLRVIKLVGDFPRTSYVVAYDRNHVERAIERVHGGAGGAFLEKVVQATHEIPHLTTAQLSEMLDTELRHALRDLPGATPLDSKRWPGVRMGLVMPLLTTVRDVRRLTSVVPTALVLTNGEVNPVDVIALEALRLQAPALHATLPAVAPLLTAPRSAVLREFTSDHVVENQRREVQAFVAAAGADYEPVATRLVQLLFPGAAPLLGSSGDSVVSYTRLLAERRVATMTGLLTYLGKEVLTGSVSAAQTTAALDALDDPERFERVTENLSTSQLHELVRRLTFQLKDAPLSIPMVIASLSNMQTRTETGPTRTFDPYLHGLTVPFANALQKDADTPYDDSEVWAAFQMTTSLTAQLRFIQLVSVDQTDDGQAPSVSSEVLDRMKASHTEAVMRATAAELLEQSAFDTLVLLLQETTYGRDRLGVHLTNTRFLREILGMYAPAVATHDGDDNVNSVRDHAFANLTEHIGHDAFKSALTSVNQAELASWTELDKERLRLGLAFATTNPDDSAPPGEPNDA